MEILVLPDHIDILTACGDFLKRKKSDQINLRVLRYCMKRESSRAGNVYLTVPLLTKPT
jgi:hypothetical protein